MPIIKLCATVYDHYKTTSSSVHRQWTLSNLQLVLAAATNIENIEYWAVPIPNIFISTMNNIVLMIVCNIVVIHLFSSHHSKA